MNRQKRGSSGASLRELFHDQAGIQTSHTQPPRGFGGVHAHKAQFARGFQRLFGKNRLRIPMRCVGRELFFREGLGAGDIRLLIIVQFKIHSECSTT